MTDRLKLFLVLVGVACCNAATPMRAPDAAACGVIQTSSYDQSCTTDNDCVAVTQGDLCDHQTCTDCINGTVNRRAEERYRADFAARLTTPVICPCPSGPPVVCRDGMCKVGLGP
jgi:nitrogenase subunit NifH